jgi:hypothetical protein
LTIPRYLQSASLFQIVVSSLAFIAVLPDSARSQVPGPETPPQIRKEFVLGQQLAGELERNDGRINDPAIVDCVQRIANRLAGATGGKAMDIRITLDSDRYAYLLPHGVLYISGALLERVESEAEIAGLLAHQLAHLRQPFAPSQGPAGARCSCSRRAFLHRRPPHSDRSKAAVNRNCWRPKLRSKSCALPAMSLRPS